MADEITVVVDGEPIRAVAGETVAAALIGADRTSWRTTRVSGERRGLFCGIGVCFDCLVTINGVSSVRACLAVVKPGDVITTERGAGHAELSV